MMTLDPQKLTKEVIRNESAVKRLPPPPIGLLLNVSLVEVRYISPSCRYTVLLKLR